MCHSRVSDAEKEDRLVHTSLAGRGGREFTDGESDPVHQLACDPGHYPPHGWLTLAQPALGQQGA
ncbi:hypothetical protein GCM10010415_12420 [Streptomyces atrovirens]